MIKHIASSFAARLATMAITLVIVVMNSHVLGSSGQGQASLIQFGILLLVSVSSYIGGGAVVYLIPRTGPKALVAPVYLTASAVAVAFYPLLQGLELLEAHLILPVCILGWMQSLFTFHLQVLVGRERIHTYNLIVVAQSATLALGLAVFYLVFDDHTIQAYIQALYIAFGCTWLVSALLGMRLANTHIETVPFKEAFSALWRYGKYGQTGNLFQLMIYRSPLYFLEKTMASGLAAAGIFSIGFYAAEAIWTVGKSISLVQHARIANSDDRSTSTRLTVAMFLVSTVASIGLTALALVLPEEVYLVVFGDDMRGISHVLLGLALGIVANSGSVILAHHFSGTGRHRFNTVASGAGLGVLLLFVYPGIDNYGLHGAALAASMGYLVQLSVLLFLFITTENVRSADWKSGAALIKHFIRLS